jgi:glycosyltransferase involved in cell wall biosynthesis
MFACRMTEQSKPKLLFVAPHLPRYDRYSGDLRMYRFLEILSEGHEIVFLAQGETGERPQEEERYLASLDKLNIKTYVRDYSLAKILLAASFKAAIIEFHYIADHYIPRIRILRPNCHVIVDTVDLHYRRAFSKYDVTRKPKDFSAAEKTKRKELDTYRKADVIVTVTDEDADILQADCPGLTVWTIPNIHDPVPVREENGNRNLLFVGGFRHEPNVDAILYFCEEVFPKIRQAIPDCTLTIVGSNPPEEIGLLQSDSIHVAGYVPSLDPFFRSSYISVAPLRFGAGMKGKVGEAMAEGLPVVTTSIGAQGMDLVHRNNAMICDAPVEFADSVVELMRNRELYETVRKNALEKIHNTCGTANVGKRVADMMSQLDHRKPNRMGFMDKMAFASKFLKKVLP